MQRGQRESRGAGLERSSAADPEVGEVAAPSDNSRAGREGGWDMELVRWRVGHRQPPGGAVP